MYDPSPSPPPDQFSSEFCDFVDACLRKDADSRPSAEQVGSLMAPVVQKRNRFDSVPAIFPHVIVFGKLGEASSSTLTSAQGLCHWNGVADIPVFQSKGPRNFPNTEAGDWRTRDG
jgi:serine/threonine protein kinase